MKHIRPDYDRIQDPEEKIPADEPVFLVRGQDVSGPATVRFWGEQNLKNGGDPLLSAAAFIQAEQMEAWPTKKAPDVPEFSVEELAARVEGSARVLDRVRTA